MSEIILNEREWVEGVMDRLELGRKPVETISRLARYLYADGLRKDEISCRIEDFMIKCDPTINVVKWQGIIDSVARNAGKYPLINIAGVKVTTGEMKSIGKLKGKILQRLMFTLLCLAKYRNAISETNNSWVNSDTKEIFLLANIKVTNKRQALMINDLWKAGYIGYSRVVDNININVRIIDEESDEAMFVSDFRNLGNQYMMAIGENYIACSECGAVVKKISNVQKYCKDCSPAVNRQLTLDNYHKSVA